MMIVVQDQNELLFNSFQHLVQKNIDGAFGMLRQFAGGFLKIRKHRFAKAGHLLPDPKSEVTKKHGRVGVGVVQLVPDKLSLVSAQKVGDQRGFSRTGVGGDQG